MAVHKILLFEDDRDALRAKSDSVKAVDKRTKKLIRDLVDTLKASPDGIGLAAPQINIHQQVIAVCLGGQDQGSSEKREPTVMINPEIIEAADERKDFDGCLSFPGLYGETFRPHYLHVAGLDIRSQHFDTEFEGFDAIVIHHEIDHLEGILFIDRIEHFDDLYRVQKDETGELVRIPVRALDPTYYGGRI